MKFDDLIVNHLGEFGPYQKLQFFLVCLPTLFTAMHTLSWTFTAASVPNRCRMPNEPPDADYWLANGTIKVFQLQNDCDLLHHPSWKTCPYEQCQIGNQTQCLNGYIYDHSEVDYSAIERWEIVCGRHIIKAIIQSMYYVGQMFGSLVFGFLGDRIGRKKVFVIALLLQVVAGCMMVIVPHWILFAILRIIVGCAHPGIFVIAVVIGMELCGPSKRRIASVLTGMFFSLGQMLLGITAYFLSNYQYLQAAIALPTIVFVAYWWIIPESARWLMSQGRYKEADEVLQRVAKMNKSELPEKWWEEIELSPTQQTGVSSRSERRRGFLDLLRTPKIRKISLIAFFCWPVVSLVYYGLAMNPTILGGNLYVNFIFGGLMEILASTLVFFVVDRIGRKPLLAGGFLVASLCSLSNFFVNKESHWMITLVQFLIAKCAITTTYATIYTFTPELFPTVIRNTAMGVCSMMARIGAILASFISLWLVEVIGKVVMILPCSILGIVAGVLAFIFLPETNGHELYETIEELEGQTKLHELQPLSKEQLTSSPELGKSKEASGNS